MWRALVAGPFELKHPARKVCSSCRQKTRTKSWLARVDAFCLSGRKIRVFAEMPVSGPAECQWPTAESSNFSCHHISHSARPRGTATTPTPVGHSQDFCKSIHEAEDTAHVKCDRPPLSRSAAWTNTCSLTQHGQGMVMTSRQVALMTRPGESKSLAPVIIR